MKTIYSLLFYSFISIFFFVSCRSYKEITRKPNRLSDEVVIPAHESDLIFAIKIDLATLEKEINAAFSKGYQNHDEGTFQYKSWIKTKDPLYNASEFILTKDPFYNPNKWIKTKDPLYNPKKWIKFGFGKTKNPLYHPNKWLETKNPAYHPNEWIKTNNPLYHPNEWIETKGPSVAVGYRYDFSVKLKDQVRLTYVNEHTLRVNAPISISGSAGFQGSLPAALTLDKKNFDGAIEFLIDTRIGISPDWCPMVEANVSHKWISNPQIEIMDNIYISITGVTDKYLDEIEKSINSTIRSQIKCETFQSILKDNWKHYGLTLPGIYQSQYYLNINPTNASISTLKFYDDTLALSVGVKSIVSVNDRLVNTTNSYPQLEDRSISSSQVKVFLPIQLKYGDIAAAANMYLKEANLVLNRDLVFNKKAKIQIREMDIYPNGDEVVVGVNVKVKLPGNVLPVKGWLYLVGHPTMVGNKKFELDSIDFSMTVNNKFYPIISSIFKQPLINLIKRQTTRDMTDSVEIFKEKLLTKVNTFEHPNLSVKIRNLDFGVNDIVLSKDEIAIIAELSSNFDVSFKR